MQVELDFGQALNKIDLCGHVPPRSAQRESLSDDILYGGNRKHSLPAHSSRM
jgi:hypothetical protein